MMELDWFRVKRGQDEFAARLLKIENRETRSGTESQQQVLVSFTVREGLVGAVHERTRKLALVNPTEKLINNKNLLQGLFARVYGSRDSDVEEWVPSGEEIQSILAETEVTHA